LPPEAWKDPATELYAFRAQVVPPPAPGG